MKTYSVNTGTNTESISYNLSNDSQFNNLLNSLSDNDYGYINPIDIRNTALSLWSNSAFKETKTESEYYIGVDTGNPNDKDLKYKMLIGKREINGNDVFNYDMYSSDSDIYFYNTKPYSEIKGETKISILSGVDSSYFKNSPFISSNYLSDLDSITFNIVNDNGKIDILSENNTVTINEIIFPTINENSNYSSLNNKILKLENGKLTWSNTTLELSDPVGNINDNLNIQGNVSINDYNIEFLDSRYTSIEIGDIKKGEKFEKISLSEILKRVIYTYQGPEVSLELLSPYENGFIEVGTTPNIYIKYSIFKKTLSTNNTLLVNMIPNIHPPISNDFHKTVTGTASAIISPSPVIIGTYSYSISTSDGIESVNSTINLISVYPFYYGVGINNSSIYNGMYFLHKLVESKTNKELQIIGEGNIYFIYPSEYGQLSEILYDNTIDIINSFTYSLINFNSPEGNFASKEYYVYESLTTYTYETPILHSFNF